MSLTSFEFYAVSCDWPGCRARTEDDDGGMLLGMDGMDARADAHDWLTNHDGNDYCPDHLLLNENENWAPLPATWEALMGEQLSRIPRSIERELRRADSIIANLHDQNRFERSILAHERTVAP